MNDSNIKVICVLGVTCSGKSTYCEKLRNSYTNESGGTHIQKTPLLLQMGRFFRNIIGPSFFAKLDNPAAPDATECWVRNMVWNAQTFAYNYGRDLIIDGFPRTPDQFDWLMLSSLVSNKAFPVEMVYITVAEGILLERLLERKVADRSQAALLDARAKKDVALTVGTYKAIKGAILSKHYPNLKLTEIAL